MTHSTDIVAYTYKADIYCPSCTVLALMDQCKVDDDDTVPSIDDTIRNAATRLGIDYDDLYTYDSDEFPKPVFADQVDEYDDPCECGAVI